MRKFIHQLNQQCSSTILHIRQEIAQIIFSRDASCFSTSYDHASEVEFQKLFKFNVGLRKYPALAPVLYPNFKKNAKTLFHTSILVKVSDAQSSTAYAFLNTLYLLSDPERGSMGHKFPQTEFYSCKAQDCRTQMGYPSHQDYAW